MNTSLMEQVPSSTSWGACRTPTYFVRTFLQITDQRDGRAGWLRVSLAEGSPSSARFASSLS